MHSCIPYFIHTSNREISGLRVLALPLGMRVRRMAFLCWSPFCATYSSTSCHQHGRAWNLLREWRSTRPDPTGSLRRFVMVSETLTVLFWHVYNSVSINPYYKALICRLIHTLVLPKSGLVDVFIDRPSPLSAGGS